MDKLSGYFKYSVTSICLLFNSFILQAQQDTEFWFAAPHITKYHPAVTNWSHPGASPVCIKITTFDLAAKVEVSIPANPAFIPITKDVDANSTIRIPLWENANDPADIVIRKMVENYVGSAADALIPKNKGLQIKADNEITCYYEVEEYYNTDIFALKGRNALGTDFFVPFQTNGGNGPYDNIVENERTYSSIDIVAVDQGTTHLMIYPTKAVLGFGSAPFPVTLEYGQTISLIPDGYSKTAANRLAGTRIVSVNGKNRIAVTMKDDSVIEGSCRDLVGDQVIPVMAIPAPDDLTSVPDPLIGAEYVIMKGNVQVGREKIYILATQPGTTVEVTGISPLVPPTSYLLNSQQQATHTIVSNITFVRSTDLSKPIYVLHITGAGDGCEIGGSILPSISRCSGSFKSGFIRSDVPNDQKKFFINIMGRKTASTNALDDFKLIRGNDTGGFYPPDTLSAASFIQIPGTDWWAASFLRNDIKPLRPNFVVNDSDVFHLGIMHGDAGGGGSYGYFSNYGSVKAISYVVGTVQPNAKVCYGQTIQLFAGGGNSYEWIPGTYLSDPYTAMPFCTPFADIKYKIIVRGASCTIPDTTEISVLVGDSINVRFKSDIYQGCAPLTVTLTDMSYNVDHKYSRWDWGDGQIDYGTKYPPPHTYRNTTNQPIDYTIQLVGISLDGYCNGTWESIIRVYPEINAGFTQDTTAGCHPINISFQDTSSGNLDTAGYFWYFGELGQSFELNPSFTFTNIGLNDSIYKVMLVTRSPFYCTDTANVNILVHPYIKASLALDTAISCSPMQIQLKVNNSIGVDTFKWNINYAGSVSKFNTLNYNHVPITHTDNTLASPDTIKINLVTLNRMGCADTFPERKIIVMPVVTADFDIDNNEICDSVRVTFTNLSSGYKLRYDLNFGDGVSAVDTVKKNYTHRYFNRTTSDIAYTATLTTISDNMCIDVKDTNIIVHPYVKANFALEFESNCAPINVNVSNLSTNASGFEWNWGDGTPSGISGASSLSHQYWNPLPDRDTTYTLTLRVISAEGCMDSLKRNILIFPQVVAAFEMDKATGCNELTIAFQNNSMGKNLSYNWQFGPDLSSSINLPLFQRTFNHRSSNDSTFDVTLTAFNSFGCDSIIKKPVTVYAYIDADFVIEKGDSCSPFPVKITNRSPAGAKYYEWNFGDGTPVNTAFEPTHTYYNTSLLNRTDNLMLVVKNNHACYDTMIKPVTVYPEIVTDFIIDKTEGCQPLTINFVSNNTNIKTNTEFYWSFGDGTYSTRVNPLPKVFSNNEYVSVNRTIKLHAISRYGCTDSISKPITIYPFIYAKFAVDRAAVCSEEEFKIDRSATYGGISQYLWDFNNDGTIDSNTELPEFNHSYSNSTLGPQNTNIKLTVKNPQGCESIWAQQIVVYPEIEASFMIDNSEPCYPHLSYLHNTSKYKDIVATKFFWYFGDGSVSTNAADYVPYQFKNFDNYTDKPYIITLIAESDYKCRDTISHSVTIHPKPNAEFNFPVTVDCPPFAVPFSNLSRGTDLTYEWNFDDGTTVSTEKDPIHTFYNNGYVISEKNIKLIATTQFECKDTVYKPILVYPKVNVDFRATAWQACSPIVINFDGSAINQSFITWYLNDEPFSTLENPAYRFVNNTPDNRTYNIRFKATSLYNCTADTMKQITIFPSPMTEFIPTPVLQDFNTNTDITTVEFMNYTQHQDTGPWNYLWSFGDGSTSANNQETFIKEYSIWGDINNKNTIPVSLMAWNRNNPECRDSAQHNIIINPPIPQIDIADDVAGCAPLSVQFTSTTKYIYEDSYSWDFGYNGQTGAGSAPAFTYYDPGVYIVKLIVEGDGGLNWDYKKIIVHRKPGIDFTFTPELVMLRSETETGTPVKFFNNTMMGEDYTWNFGDDSPLETEKEPEHEYIKTGKYYITLIATSPEGCMDTMTHPIPVIVEGARNLKFPNAFIVDPSGPIDENYDPDKPDRNIFRPVAAGVVKYKLEIYNRWGELIWMTEDVNKGWNGYVNGKPAKQDVYVWRVTATFTDGRPLVEAGDVTLLVRPQ